MNPPFARDSLRYDQFTEAEEELIKARESALLADTPAHRSGGTHGFTVLAQRHLKRNGRIAAVYPIAMAQAKSAYPVRSSLFGAMRVEYVVALKDPEGMAFSENTSIGEMLVVASPWPPDADRENTPTAFVKILRKPQTPAQARAIGEAILRDEKHPDYDVTRWPQARMQQGDWFPTQFVRDECVAAFENVSSGAWFPSADNLYRRASWARRDSVSMMLSSKATSVPRTTPCGITRRRCRLRWRRRRIPTLGPKRARKGWRRATGRNGGR